MKHKFEATICNYMPELRGEKYVDSYMCYADFHVKYYRENTAVGGYLPPIEFFIQPEYDKAGKIVSMYGGAESDDERRRLVLEAA